MADEPTAALDPSRAYRDFLTALLAKEQGCTVLMVTHDPRIMDIDRVAYLEDGVLRQE